MSESTPPPRVPHPLVETLLQAVLDGVTREGSRFLKAQATSAATEAVDVIRKVLSLHYIVQGLVFLNVGSFLLWTYALVERGSAVQEFSEHRGFWYALGLWLAVTLLLLISVRRSLWLRWTGLSPHNTERASASAGLSPSEIEALVQKTVEQTLANRS